MYLESRHKLVLWFHCHHYNVRYRHDIGTLSRILIHSRHDILVANIAFQHEKVNLFDHAGPATWVKSFPAAGGQKQSPIDINPGSAAKESVGALSASYKAGNNTLTNTGLSFAVSIDGCEYLIFLIHVFEEYPFWVAQCRIHHVRLPLLNVAWHCHTITNDNAQPRVTNVSGSRWPDNYWGCSAMIITNIVVTHMAEFTLL